MPRHRDFIDVLSGVLGHAWRQSSSPVPLKFATENVITDPETLPALVAATKYPMSPTRDGSRWSAGQGAFRQSWALVGDGQSAHHPHSQAHYWRTAGGAEVDLLLERADGQHALEIKTARATSPHLARSLRAILEDTGALSATVIDQGPGTDPLAPGITRRGFGQCWDWLP